MERVFDVTVASSPNSVFAVRVHCRPHNLNWVVQRRYEEFARLDAFRYAHPSMTHSTGFSGLLFALQ